MIKLCVFDLDGTLVDSLPDISQALTTALNELHLPSFSEQEYRRKVGNGARKLCERCLPDGQEALLDTLLARYNELYLQHCTEHTFCYPGTEALIRRLHNAGIMTAVISNKPHSQTLKVAADILPEAPFDVVFGQREGVPLKPAPDALLKVMQQLNTTPEETMFIGDSPVDLQFGKSAGVEVCGVTWGYRDRKELEAERPDCIADTCDVIFSFAVQSIPFTP